jgi:hypothetical protein
MGEVLQRFLKENSCPPKHGTFMEYPCGEAQAMSPLLALHDNIVKILNNLLT